MGDRHGRWAIVLGAGDGTRLRALTTHRGVAVPKQYCSIHRGPSLLQLAFRRARRVVPRGNVVTVLAEQHRRWWTHELTTDPAIHAVVQPANRGTAAGVLLPLLEVMRHEPEAVVAILPSDHYVEREAVLARALEAAFESVEDELDSVVTLGIDPDAPETGYGWIVPGTDGGGPLRSVASFVEKPDAPAAASLMTRGALWNSFLLVTRAATLLALFELRLPALVETLRGTRAERGQRSLAAIYTELPVQDFSRDLMQGAEPCLRVLRVPPCGWTDLGTPDRVARCVRGLVAACPPVGRVPARPDLVSALAAGV